MSIRRNEGEIRLQKNRYVVDVEWTRHLASHNKFRTTWDNIEIDSQLAKKIGYSGEARGFSKVVAHVTKSVHPYSHGN